MLYIGNDYKYAEVKNKLIFFNGFIKQIGANSEASDLLKNGSNRANISI